MPAPSLGYYQVSNSLPAFIPGAAQINAAQRLAAESIWLADQQSLALGAWYALTPQRKRKPKRKGEWLRSQIGQAALPRRDTNTVAKLYTGRTIEVGGVQGGASRPGWRYTASAVVFLTVRSTSIELDRITPGRRGSTSACRRSRSSASR